MAKFIYFTPEEKARAQNTDLVSLLRAQGGGSVSYTHLASKRDTVYRSPTLCDSVVQMLHHMGRIFEDNSKADGTLYGLRIDRKRRREIQRKRLAMGHKPDDHRCV